ncbi:MAG: type III secretion system outer membrane ring subunit SctC [Pseudomonadales bacterium]
MKYKPFKFLLACLQGSLMLVAFLLILSTIAHAGEPSWPQEPVSLQVQEQQLSDFLQDFFSAAGLRVLVSEGVKGRISGRFSDKPEKVFNNLVKAYGLLPYYDGAVFHISSAQEIQSKSIQVKPAQVDTVVQQLVAQDLVDDYQSVQVASKNGLIKVRGAREFILDVEEMVQSVAPRPRGDAPAVVHKAKQLAAAKRNELVFRTFRLKYASAGDVTFYQNGQEVNIPGVATMLRSMVGDGQSAQPAGINFNAPRDSTVRKLRGQGLQRYNGDAEEGEKMANGGSNTRSTPSGQAGNIRIEAERNLNAVIVRDRADAMPLYEDLIKQLDKEPMLVEIQVTIIDIDKSKLQDLGVDWRFQNNDTSVQLGGGDVLEQTGGLLLNTVLGDSGRFFASVNALAEKGSAHVVSRPQVLTLSNIEAVLASDQTFFVRVAGNDEVDLFDVSVGTSLRVLPNVVGSPGDPQIRLLVTIEDGTIAEQQTVDDIPVIDRSSLNTQAVIYNGESLLLGGLVRETTTKDTTKVPLLGDVPGVGTLFKRTIDIDTKSERLFLISPRVVNTNRRKVQHEAPPPTNRPEILVAKPESRVAVRSGLGASPEQADDEPDVHNRKGDYLDGF